MLIAAGEVDMTADGTKAVNGRVFFATKGWADGKRCDTEGDVCCSFTGGKGEAVETQGVLGG